MPFQGRTAQGIAKAKRREFFAQKFGPSQNIMQRDILCAFQFQCSPYKRLPIKGPVIASLPRLYLLQISLKSITDMDSLNFRCCCDQGIDGRTAPKFEECCMWMYILVTFGIKSQKLFIFKINVRIIFSEIFFWIK